MIVCCGEALIDMIPTGNSETEQSLTPHAGGAVFNTAIGLGRLEVGSSFLSGVSTDLFGKLLTTRLEESRVATDRLIRSDRPTTLAFVTLDDGQASYLFYDENTAGRMLDPNALPDVPDTANAMYFGGISLINEPAADFYVALAKRESKQRVIICDPNIRANFIKDESRFRARLEEMIAVVDILKVSDVDLDWLVPGEATHLEKAASLRGAGPSVIVLTRGSDGACAVFGANETVEVPVEKVQVVDTVGAGDTFNSGFLAHLSKEGLLEKDKIKGLSAEDVSGALRFGAKVAAVTVSRAGANPPWLHELS